MTDVRPCSHRRRGPHRIAVAWAATAALALIAAPLTGRGDPVDVAAGVTTPGRPLLDVSAGEKESAATRATDAPLASIIRDAITDLGSEDYSVRERGMRRLWDIGDPAVPGLTLAASSDDPEVVNRSRHLLYSLKFGIRPDTPPNVIALLASYRQGNRETRLQLIPQLAEHGHHGIRVLLKLIEAAGEDPAVRAKAILAMSDMARGTAGRFIALGEYKTLERLLSLSAGASPTAARDYAAFLLVRGGLEAELKRLEKHDQIGPPKDGGVDTSPAESDASRRLRLAAMLRASNDTQRAAAAADEGGDTALADLYLADAAQWGELANRMLRRGLNERSVEDLGLLVAYLRLSGRRAEADKYAAMLAAFPPDLLENAGNEANVVEALMLNGYPELALKLLESRENAADAVDFMVSRLEIDRAIRLSGKANREGVRNRAMVAAQSAGPLIFKGLRAEAAELLTAVANGEYGDLTLDVWLEVILTAPSAGIAQEQIDRWVGAQLTSNAQSDVRDRIFRRARIAETDRAVHWFAAFRDQRVNLEPAAAVALIRRLDRRLVPADELAALITRTAMHAETLPRAERARRLEMLADVLADNDRIADAISRQQQACEITDTQASNMRLGDLLARGKQWNEAVAAYDKALRLSDGLDASAVALKGWATMQAGDKEGGRKLIEQAHLMPLGDEGARHELAGALERNQLTDEAMREHQYINRTGDGKQWAYTDSLRRMAARTARGTGGTGSEPAADANPLAAAEMWERAFLANFAPQMSFVEPSANLTIPALIRRTRAVGAARAGRTDDAVRIAAEILEMHPGDTDSQIAIVRALDRAGQRKAADAVHAAAYKSYEAVRQALPGSAAAHNLVAWLCGCTQRDLDAGLKVAQRAVEMDPENAAYLDTLAEVHYARREYDLALKINARCRELEPWVEHHKQNLARFNAAKAGKRTDAPLEGDGDE